jgi:NCAIR mutase (PurE)-related protein
VDRRRLRKLLNDVSAGRLAVDEAVERMRIAPYEDLDFAKIDLHRAVRTGFPEVVYGPGKSDEQIAAIVQRLSRAGQTVLVTRVEPAVHRSVSRIVPEVEYHAEARALSLRAGRKARGRPGVVVITAGTSDRRVGEEAALIAELMGNQVELIRDCGVAGLHRLLAHHDRLLKATVVVAVAGMEGALPSVVAGLVDCPVIGVPTSVGYGTGEQGRAALMAMLNSCAMGVTVVNIDNGFGAGYAAGLINQARKTRRRG